MINLALQCSHPRLQGPVTFYIARLHVVSDDPLSDVAYYPVDGKSGFQLLQDTGQAALICKAARLVLNRRTRQWSLWYFVAGDRTYLRSRRVCRELQGCSVTEVAFQ